MKGVIVMCMSKMITEKFGKEKWMKALENAGIPGNSIFLAGQTVDDASVLKVINSLCKILDITLVQAADAFGEYWMNSFAPKVYKAYFKKVKTAKEFLLKMDSVHIEMTNTIPDAKPPRFNYEVIDANKMIMTYNSHRGLIDFMIGLVKGVGKYFNEPLTVKKLSDTQLELEFK